MKKIICMTASALAMLSANFVFAATDASPVGLWKTIDDVTGKPKAYIQISEAADHTLQGTIMKTFPDPGKDQNEICIHCKGAKHNQRIVGMTILEGLHQDKDTAGYWKDGMILDPHNGKSYHCTTQLTDNNQKLSVRGYIGMPLFGRSQVWNRVAKIDD